MLDIYSTRAQLAAIELMPAPETFLFDTFVKDMGVVEDDKAIYDFRKGAEQMAPFVTPGQGGVPMARGGFQTREIGFCRMAPERIIELNNIMGRSFGESVLGAKTPAQREKEMLTRDLKEMRAACQRRREWMAMQVLLTGKLDIFEYTNEGRSLKTTKKADYGFTNAYAPATAWGQAGAKIYDDMQAMYDLVHNGLGDVDIVVMAPDAANALIHDEAYMKTMDMKNVDMGEIRTKYRGQGVRFIGRNADGVEMYSFAGQYLDDDGQMKPFLPSGTVIMGGKGVLKCLHGPVTQVEGYGNDAKHVTYIKKEVPLRIGSSESDTIKNRLTSCPTIVPFNVDAWVVANVL